MLSRLNVVLAIAAALVTAIVIPAISAYSGYAASVQAVNRRIDDFRLESEQRFPEKHDIETLNAKLDRISDDLNQIKGYLRAKNHDPFAGR